MLQNMQGGTHAAKQCMLQNMQGGTHAAKQCKLQSIRCLTEPRGLTVPPPAGDVEELAVEWWDLVDT